MNRAVLKKIAEIRINEAKSLLATKNYCGAYYLAGYSIECALKACIAKKTRRYDFPDKNLAIKCFSHDLEGLVRVAGLEQSRLTLEKQDIQFALNWATVKDWDETSRYEIINKVKATELINSIINQNGGVLSWIRQYW